MIVEVILSTIDRQGRPNFAPMGILWGDEEVVVRPFRTTHTFRNLVDTGFGVANVTDNVLAFVETALGDPILPYFPASEVPGVVLETACYWRELQVVAIGGREERPDVRCRVVGRGRQRDFLGFNRARNAVIEATILATRLHLLDTDAVLASLDRFERIVDKTGDAAEARALARVRTYVRRWIDAHCRANDGPAPSRVPRPER